ncbi:hypothetical protein [Rhodoglobus sp.]
MLARHSDSAPPSRHRRRWSVAAAAALFAMITFVPAAGAVASVGSIPPDVSEFAASDDGLILELEEYFGVDERGGGLDFTDGIELGEIDRIFLWSEAFHSGQKTDTPVQYVNRWKVPVLIGEEPVGIAMIGIDPATVDPEMIDFIRNPGITLALDHIDEDATLVHEPETKAWFSLSDGVIIPLVRGESGIAGETTLAQYQPELSGREIEIVDPTPQPDQGSVQSVVLIATTAVVLLLALLIPTIIGQVRERRERLAEAEGGAAERGAAGDAGDAPVTDPAGAAVDTDATSPTDAASDETNADVQSSTPAASTPDVSETATSTVTTAATIAATRAPAKKAAVKKAPAKKAPAKKSTPSSSTTKTTAAKKPAASKATVGAKKSTASTSTSKASTSTSKAGSTKPTATKRTAVKPAGTKPAVKKATPATKTAPATSAAATNAAPAKKPAAKKPAAKKPAAKKAAPSKPAASPSPKATESSTD